MYLALHLAIWLLLLVGYLFVVLAFLRWFKRVCKSTGAPTDRQAQMDRALRAYRSSHGEDDLSAALEEEIRKEKGNG